MPVVFDEVVGNVEPDAVAEPADEEATEQAPQKPLQDFQRYTRLMRQREARVFAD